MNPLKQFGIRTQMIRGDVQSYNDQLYPEHSCGGKLKYDEKRNIMVCTKCKQILRPPEYEE